MKLFIIKWIIRFLLGIFFIVLVWKGYKFALYLAITMLWLSNELNCLIDELEKMYEKKKLSILKNELDKLKKNE